MRFDPLTGAGRLEAIGEGTGANIALSFALILDSVSDWLSQGVLLQVMFEFTTVWQPPPPSPSLKAMKFYND